MGQEDKLAQSSLPVKFGGLGICKATDLALPAFLASAHGASTGVLGLLDGLEGDYQELNLAKDRWRDIFSPGLTLSQDPDTLPYPADLAVQKEWDSILYEDIYKKLLSKETVPAERARLLAVASEQSSNWLNAIPVPNLGLKLDDQSLRLATGLRLGSELVVPHRCTCGQLGPLG